MENWALGSDGCDQEVFARIMLALEAFSTIRHYTTIRNHFCFMLTEYKEDASDDFAGGGHQLLSYFSKVSFNNDLVGHPSQD